MFRLIILFFISSIFLTSCSDANKTTDCVDIVCTKEFRTITVRFVDSNGNSLLVKDFKVINKRTNEILTSINDMVNPGFYVVVSDSDLLKLSENGDNVQVTATDPKTNTKIQVDFVISGGLCSCHVIKISGPETVKI